MKKQNNSPKEQPVMGAKSSGNPIQESTTKRKTSGRSNSAPADAIEEKLLERSLKILKESKVTSKEWNGQWCYWFKEEFEDYPEAEMLLRKVLEELIKQTSKAKDDEWMLKVDELKKFLVTNAEILSAELVIEEIDKIIKGEKFKHKIIDAKVIKKEEDLMPILKEGINGENEK